jgi:hypothetical protein
MKTGDWVVVVGPHGTERCRGRVVEMGYEKVCIRVHEVRRHDTGIIGRELWVCSELVVPWGSRLVRMRQRLAEWNKRRAVAV